MTMKKLLFICLMAISSLFVFADGGKISCKVTGDIAVTVASPTVKANGKKPASVDVELQFTKVCDKDVSIIINVLDKENNIVATQTCTVHAVWKKDKYTVTISNYNIKANEEYKIRISNVSCQ